MASKRLIDPCARGISEACAREFYIKDVGSLVEKSKRDSRATSSGGLRVGRGHHVSPRLHGSVCFFIPSTTARSLCPPFRPGVRASATLGRPRVANGPACLPRASFALMFPGFVSSLLSAPSSSSFPTAFDEKYLALLSRQSD